MTKLSLLLLAFTTATLSAAGLHTQCSLSSYTSSPTGNTNNSVVFSTSNWGSRMAGSTDANWTETSSCTVNDPASHALGTVSSLVSFQTSPTASGFNTLRVAQGFQTREGVIVGPPDTGSYTVYDPNVLAEIDRTLLFIPPTPDSARIRAIFSCNWAVNPAATRSTALLTQ